MNNRGSLAHIVGLVVTLFSLVGAANGLGLVGPLGRAVLHTPDIRPKGPDTSGSTKRPVTVGDTIEMTRVAGDTHYDYAPPYPPLVYFSPDGARFAIVLRRGNLQRNTNDYSMLMFETAKVFPSPVPDVLAEMSSSSNRDAIQRVKWLGNDTITFIGENADDLPQVYALSVMTRHLEQITTHATAVLDYRVSRDGTEVTFSAEGGRAAGPSSQDLREGIAITDQFLWNIAGGEVGRQRRTDGVFSLKHGGTEVRLPDKQLAVETKDTPKETIRVTLEQDLNTPAKLYVVDAKTKEKAVLLDLNPQFAALRFAPAQIITWKGKNGEQGHGALYLPLDYVPGKKYPLVIQTHFFNTDHFLIDGPWGSGYAAQALAGRGFIVAQVGELLPPEEVFDKLVNTPDEAPYVMATYEGLIDSLDAGGLIDRRRVGIFAFSRTVYYVAYTLTHSTYRFAATILEDGIDGGYFQYLTSPQLVTKTYERIYRGLPFGASLSSWTKNAPGFNLDRVESPVRIMEHGYAGALTQWEWYSGLRLLHKPVDMVILPDPKSEEQHLLKKPWERFISQQGTVDWFCYWLRGEEDSDPGKANQYARWRELRKLHTNEQPASQSSN